MQKIYTILTRLVNRKTLLVSGTLLFSISPFLCILFYWGAALISALNWKQFPWSKGRISIAISIFFLSIWMIIKRTDPEILGPGAVGVTDFFPLYIFFFLISLKPFSILEIRTFCYALALTIPQQFLMAVGENYFNWYGGFYYLVNKFPVLDFFIGPFDRGIRTSAGFFNPNILACYCVICAGTTLSLLLAEVKGARDESYTFSLFVRIFSIFSCLVLCTILLIWTGSEGGLLAFSILILIVFAWTTGQFIYTAIASSLLALISMIISGNFGWLSQRLRALLPGHLSTILSSVSESADGRRLFYSCAIELIQEKPLTGWGIGRFAPECVARTKTPMNHAHNIILQLSSEIGLPFTIIYLSFFGYLLFLSIRFLQKSISQSAELHSLASGLFAIIIAVTVMQFMDLQLLMSYRLNFLFWLCFAILYSLASESNFDHLNKATKL